MVFTMITYTYRCNFIQYIRVAFFIGSYDSIEREFTRDRAVVARRYLRSGFLVDVAARGPAYEGRSSTRVGAGPTASSGIVEESFRRSLPWDVLWARPLLLPPFKKT